MRIKSQRGFDDIGNKASQQVLNVKSDEASVTIKNGSPVFLQLDGVDDGLAVVSVESLSAHENELCMGLATTDIAPGAFGKALAFGVHLAARLVTATRAATTDVWASYPAGVIGDILTIVTATGSVQGVIRAASGSLTSARKVMFRLASAYASATTQASSIGTATSLGGAVLASTSLTRICVTVF